jgi:hypothetical protein
MNQIPTPITHPLTENVTVRANRPSCPCKGATYERVEGIVKKIIPNQSGYWYYLSTGITVKDAWIDQVL